MWTDRVVVSASEKHAEDMNIALENANISEDVVDAVVETRVRLMIGDVLSLIGISIFSSRPIYFCLAASGIILLDYLSKQSKLELFVSDVRVSLGHR